MVRSNDSVGAREVVGWKYMETGDGGSSCCGEGAFFPLGAFLLALALPAGLTGRSGFGALVFPCGSSGLTNPVNPTEISSKIGHAASCVCAKEFGNTGEDEEGVLHTLRRVSM